MPIYSSIEEWVSTSGLDIKTLFDPVNGILYLERSDGTYESKELSPSERAGFASPLANPEELARNGFWCVTPEVKFATATTTGSSEVCGSLDLNGTATDSNGNPVFEAGATFDIGYVVVVSASFDKNSQEWSRTWAVVALSDMTSDAEAKLTQLDSNLSFNWTDISFCDWPKKLNVTVRGKGLVAIDVGDASGVDVAGTTGALKVENGRFVLDGRAPVL